MANVVLNLKPLIQELTHADIKSFLKNSKNSQKILSDWDNLIKALGQAAEKISKGEKLGSELSQIGKMATSLGGCAAEFGSMLPGPIGVACSIALAIVCLIPPIDGIGFVLNLMGCIPFAKVGLKTARPLIEGIIKDALKSPMIKGCINSGRDITKKTIKYNGEYARTMYRRLVETNSRNVKTSTQYTPVGYSHSKIPPKKVGDNFELHEGGAFTPETVHQGTQIVRRTQVLGTPVTSVGNPFFNTFSHL